MEVAIKRPNILYRPLGITLAIMTTVTLWWFMSGNPTILALLAISALFTLGLKRPVWAVAALLVSQLTITSFVVGAAEGFSISLRLLLLILTFIITWRAFVEKQLALGPGARRGDVLGVPHRREHGRPGGGDRERGAVRHLLRPAQR